MADLETEKWSNFRWKATILCQLEEEFQR
uniref:Uncharacterized protein n=1 Tax=Arundo donax TaxID=35708 RepID=A0A0A8YJH5_ARUDO